MVTSKMCLVCGMEFTSRNKTCSRKCSYIKRGQDKRKDITGIKKGKLTALSRVTTNKNGHSLWEFKCDCGKTTVATYGDFTRSDKRAVKSCGCLLQRKGEHSPIYLGYREITGGYWTKIQRAAESRHLTFEVDIEFAYNLYLAQNKVCNLSGVAIEMGVNASLDRIDPRLDYTHSNIQWVHKDINKLKNKFQQEHFIEMCKAVAKYR